MKKLLILFILFTNTVSVLSQVLDSNNLKMVSCIQINNQCYNFEYDNKHFLKRIIGVSKECDNIYKDIITFDNNSITQVSYVNGKKNNRYKYVYNVSNFRIDKITMYEYGDMGICFKNVYEISYNDKKVKEILSYKTWIEEKQVVYEPQLNRFTIHYIDNNPYVYKTSEILTEEQREKYAPLYNEQEFIESKNSLKKILSYKSSDEIEYSSFYFNDTNIKLNNIIDVVRQGSNGLHSITDNIIYFTQWVNIPDYNLIKKKKKNNRILYDVKYIYEKNNLVNIQYINRKTNNIVCNINIKYLMPS